MVSIRKSIASRLALGYGLLVAFAIAIVSAVFYFGTIVVLDRSIDGKISSISNRLVGRFQDRTQDELTAEIERRLQDRIDSDTEIFQVVAADGTLIVGNITDWPDTTIPWNEVVTHKVMRDGKLSSARLIIRPLHDGKLLVVGRDLREQEAIQTLVLRALWAGGTISLVLVIAGAIFFKRQTEARIGEIRRTAIEIEAGDLSRRVPISGDDEFGRLSEDINQMLDRIEHLMDGVRHVSNAIAHDLRTPLGRIRSKLDDAVRHQYTADTLYDAANDAIEGIDDLILLFDKLLQIAGAESGMRTKSFEVVDLNRIAHDMAELYDAAAEERQVTIKASSQMAVPVMGDHDLLASAVASLIDNAIKYAGAGATVEVEAHTEPHWASVTIKDNGPGIPNEEIAKVTERFYRLDHSRHLPGNGLGLSIVTAIATLHGGMLRLEHGAPGLLARILLPQELPLPAASALTDGRLG